MKSAACVYIFLAIFMLPFGSKADHITGGEMFYEYTGVQNGNHQYRVTLRLLMRCHSGRMFPNPILVGVFSKNDNTRLMDIPVQLSSQIQIKLNNTDPCISNPPDVCYEVGEYSFFVVLPPSAAGYTLASSVNFRVNGLANLRQDGNIGATYTADIPGSAAAEGFEKNSSAHFTGSDLVVVCANNPFEYSFSATDKDGDKLEYYFCSAYQSGTFSGGPANAVPPVAPPYPEVPYGPQFGPRMPLGSSVTIDPETGLVSGIAPDIGIYVITVCVAETRGGKIIAVQRKDIQLNITGCTVAAAILQPSYQLCKDADEITFENLSGSPLIQSYSWRLFSATGSQVARSTSPRFTHRFTDTGLYKVTLQTNVGLTCPDSTSAIARYYPGFNVNFTYQGICFGNPTKFFNASTTRYGSFENFYWSLGEFANPSNIQLKANAELIYKEVGQKAAMLRVTNTNGCMDSVSKSLDISTNPPLDLNFRDTLICPPDTVDIVATGEGLFTWENLPGILSAINSPMLKVAPLISTQYIVTQNLDNCIGRDTVSVRVADRVELKVMNDTTICSGDELVLRASGNGIRFQWVSSTGLPLPALAMPSVKPVQSTGYTVTAFISKCFTEEDILIQTVPYPKINAGPDVSICFNQSTTLFAQTNSDILQWSPAASLSNAHIANPVASPPATTSYIVAAYDNEGCPKPSYDTVVVKVEPPILLQGVHDTTLVVGQPLRISMTGAPRYSWYPQNNNISNAAIPDPVILFTQPTEAIQYTVVGYNDAGCSDSLAFTIKVFATVPSVFVPTAFTPNGDGLNETLKPTLAGMQQLNFFRIFNRYGQLVFETKEVDTGWNGNVKGEKQSTGLFIWMVSAVDYLGNPVQLKGSTMLVR